MPGKYEIIFLLIHAYPPVGEFVELFHQYFLHYVSVNDGQRW
jgi:hypothetical protein